MIVLRTTLLSLALLALSAGCLRAQANDSDDRELRHQSAEWQAMASHLPDPVTGTPQALLMAADVLRARRMPEDALDFYRAALRNGGDEATIENRIGITLLELRQYDAARNALRRAVQLRPKGAQEWNNLGAAEYVAGNTHGALDDYRRAVKLDKKKAVYHANLGTAYFELKDFESARQQFQMAVRLDADVFHSGNFSGVDAHVLSSSDRGRFCFEMAKMAARQHQLDDVIRWLARSSEAGFQVRDLMDGDKDFDPYRKDPRILLALSNAHALRTGQVAESGLAPLPQ